MTLNYVGIKEWNGSLNTLNATNLHNYRAINTLIDNLNSYADVMPYFSHYFISLDTTSSDELNRIAWNQFNSNCTLINSLLPQLVKNCRFMDYSYTLQLPKIPNRIDFDKDDINTYWNAVSVALNWCVDESNKFINNSSITIPDKPDATKGTVYFKEFYNDKSTYKPGDTAQIIYSIVNGKQVTVQYNYTLVAQPPLGNVINIKQGAINIQPSTTYKGSETWQLPFENNQGYVLIFTLTDIGGNVVTTATSAIDSASSWTNAPRYGAVTNFTPEDQTTKDNISGDISTLNKFHINATMYYDAYFRPQNPLPGKQYQDWLGNTIDLGLVQKGIATNHKYGQSALLYNMINATTGTPSDSDTNMANLPELFGKTITRADGTKGIASKMGVFRTDKVITSVPANTFDDKGEQATFNMLGSFNDRDDVDHKVQYYYNPASTDWQNYIGKIMIDNINALGFDGWQGDTIGNIYGTTYEDRGQSNGFNTADSYAYFINSQKEKFFGGKLLGMNTVNYTGQDKLNGSLADFNYSELWQSDYPTYQDLANCIEKVNDNSNKPLIIPTYMYHDWYQSGSDDLPKYFKDETILLKDAVIMAHGGSPMELADNGYQLPTEYYPDTRKHYRIMMTDKLGNPDTGLLRKMYDFATSYSGILYGARTSSTRVEVYNNMGSDVGSRTAAPFKIYAFTKQKGNIATINLINLLNTSNVNWQINNKYDEQSKKIVEQVNTKVRYYTNANINQVCVSTYDNGGIRQFINTTHGENQYGKYIDIVVPSLKVWDLIYFELN